MKIKGHVEAAVLSHPSGEKGNRAGPWLEMSPGSIKVVVVAVTITEITQGKSVERAASSQRHNPKKYYFS